MSSPPKLTLLQQLSALNDKLIPTVPDESPGFRVNHVINTFKFAMLFIGVSLLIIYDNFSLPALLIVLFHGSYGMIWVCKDIILPDKSFDFKTNYTGSLVIFLVLIGYSSMQFTVISNPEYRFLSVDRMFVAGFCYIFGVVLMMAADAQKTFVLRVRKGLIMNGLFSTTRNPNYCGEIMLYFSFGVLAQSTFCYGYLLSIWLGLFWMRMDEKDRSLAKKDGWNQYSKKSFMLLPKFFSSNMLNYMFYAGIVVLATILYKSGGLFNRIIEFRSRDSMIGW